MARHDSKRKIERNRALMEYIDQHPDLTLQEIGEVFNISRQRVWELKQNMRKATDREAVA